ncbi:MAG: hypothetical protein JO328_18810 [Hyphomicrobiales bacterium]|nr:hypothetical protein [Hyphomicrobiales bacterium]MBV8825466.1 hypothetical protein [Hyphomicrobiales bacterium]MBV9429484.1 hypothetical protein [Bradyrhizobiaceae bacterium]
MDTLQEALLKAAGQVPHLMLAQLLDEKLKAQGFKFSKSRIHKIVQHIITGNTEGLTFGDKRRRVQEIKIDVKDEDLERMTKRVDDFIRNVFPRVTEDLVEAHQARFFKH